MTFIILSIIAALATVVNAATKQLKSMPITGYDTESWRPIVTSLCPSHDIPIPIAMQWIDMESGGKPCAIGKPGAKGPDGYPKEMGIAQLYNPDDLQQLKVSSYELRAYCVPNTDQCSRRLTPEEMRQQVDLLIGKIDGSRKRADGLLKSSGVSWSGSDYWAFVKLQHGLPGLARSGLFGVIKNLNRAPANFGEFRRVVLTVDLSFDKGTWDYKTEFPRVLANAVKLGAALGGSPNV